MRIDPTHHDRSCECRARGTQYHVSVTILNLKQFYSPEDIEMLMNTQHSYDSAQLKVCQNQQRLLRSMLEHKVCPKGTNPYPTDTDVICARGRQAQLHPGNQRFKRIILDHHKAYFNAASKMHKTIVVSNIIDAVRMNGDFVRVNTNTGIYEKISERLAREKVGQGLRDVLHIKYSSSTKAKKRRKIEQQKIQDEQLLKIVMGNIGVQKLMADLTGQLILHGDNCSDEVLDDIFLKANMDILDELKRSACIPASPNSSYGSNIPVAATDDNDGSQADSDYDMVDDDLTGML